VKAIDASHYLLEMQLLREKIPSFDEYPFSLPVIRNLEKLAFYPAVTFIIGENGTGKSTLLEAIATAWGFNPEGGSKNFRFSTRKTHSNLNDYIRLSKSYRKARDGFFLRAESFYNVASNIDELDEDPDFGPPIKNSYGGLSLHNQSHGESFFSLFMHRFSGNGLYILDEPEAALSPTRQLAILRKIHELVENNSQFIIATHSPIILAYPNSKIYEISDGKIQYVEYMKTDNYLVTKGFINKHETILKELLS
jgi:predicted ATPase